MKKHVLNFVRRTGLLKPADLAMQIKGQILLYPKNRRLCPRQSGFAFRLRIVFRCV